MVSDTIAGDAKKQEPELLKGTSEKSGQELPIRSVVFLDKDKGQINAEGLHMVRHVLLVVTVICLDRLDF